MSSLQVKNFPDDLRAVLVRRARAQGVSLSAHVVAELRRAAAWPTMAEWLAQLEAEPPAGGSAQADGAAAVAEARQEYDPDERHQAP
ncbi:MAG: hypothetical protein LBE08_11415 [Bifidobacteriaceae bacterium]|jgi:plasmid stability protein|nr:hypothetical protein [Bifidobacteriaceae bacterium]